MSREMNVEELKTLIAKQIREKNLHAALPDDAVEKIKNKILANRDRESIKEMPSIVSELEGEIPPHYPGDNNVKFPDSSQIIDSPEQQVNVSGGTDSFNMPSGSNQTEQPSQPTVGYTPELPEMLQKASPSELFVFRYNDIRESGENLSNKPMRLMDEPDVMKSMYDLWMEHGKTKAKVYVAKFEEMGEIEFNYTNGTSKFTEKSSLPDYAGNNHEYKENPYVAETLPQIDEPTKENLENYIKSSIDLEKVVHDIVMGIVKDSLLTNTEKAVSSDEEIKEDIAVPLDRPGYGTETSQLIKPMEEGEFSLTMEDIAGNDDRFEKITLPSGLNESIVLGDKKMIVNENEHVREWEFQGKRFFTPVNRISKTKGYIKR